MRPATEFAAALNPALVVPDVLAAWWVRQVVLRLRREVCWTWWQRTGAVPTEATRLPPPGDAAQECLDLSRFHDDRRRFFADDVTARYLTEQLDAMPRPDLATGPWVRAAREARLSDAAQFVLAFALAARLDGAMGAVCAALHGDAARTFPTLGLAQRLADDPFAVAAVAHAGHPLFAFGLLDLPDSTAGGPDWNAPLAMPAVVALTLAGDGTTLPAGLIPLRPNDDAPHLDEAAATLGWLAASPPIRMQIVPLAGPAGADFDDVAAACGARTDRPVARIADETSPRPCAVAPLAAAAWLLGVDLLVPEHWTATPSATDPWHADLHALPLRWYVPVTDRSGADDLPTPWLAPTITVPPLDYAARLDALRAGLGLRGASIDPALTEAARRFRFQSRAARQIVETLRAGGPKIDAEQLFAACRSRVADRLGSLAQTVTPRFTLDDLVLPPDERRQVDEIVRAMRSLTRVHHEWGGGTAWNDAGLSVLFAGGPGTGKTMAAEAISRALALPMVRIDLSQVVNKYIGETEKNLSRIFDAAEASDALLLFDEADALFGKRTDVKDAHDRFANIEVSYLLERMERFKGLAVLSTNRRRDLDEAFTRRLRYIVEFPMPGEAERLALWRRSFPPGADIRRLDLAFLATQFELSGGHIRSVAFNACLQAASASESREVSMTHVLTALQRELAKLGRPAHAGLFGRYADRLEAH